MKKSFKLLVLVLALLAMVAIVASCDFGNGEDDTTTAATTTTTAVTTTAAVGIPQEELDKIHYNNLKAEIVFDGRALDSSDVGVTKPGFLKAIYTFEQVHPETGALIEDLGTTYPTNVGTYKITAMFSWQNGAQDDYPGATLPAPVSATFKIVPGDANRASTFGVNDGLVVLYHPDMQYDPATATGAEAFATGNLPLGVTISGATIEKLESADATTGTPVEGGKITDEGYYRVTLNYAQEGENYTAASLAGKTGVIEVFKSPNQVLRKDNIRIDGVIDPEYKVSAHLSTRNQAYKTGWDPSYTVYGYTLLGDDIVDPMYEIPLLEVWHAPNAGPKEEGSKIQATVYALWGARDGEDCDYVYLAIEVYDPTDCLRYEAYDSYPNPWVSDNIEFYYHFGGRAAPEIVGSNTYPTYNAVTNNSRVGPNVRPSAVDDQKSIYFADIEFASTRVPDGEGGVTYVLEYAFPAKSESFTGYGTADFERHEGEALTAGEYLYLAFQFNDLTALNTVQNPLNTTETPDTPGYYYDSVVPSGNKYQEGTLTFVPDSDWKKFEGAIETYMASYGSRDAWYLKHEQGGPSYFQLSATPAVVEQ